MDVNVSYDTNSDKDANRNRFDDVIVIVLITVLLTGNKDHDKVHGDGDDVVEDRSNL